MRINTNTAALNAWRNLMVSDTNMSKSLERLSSGFRISKASDDAAGLAISEKMKSQIGGLSMAQRNAQDGISLIQTAEGGLAETSSILLRMRDLANQATTSTVQQGDREKIALEFGELQKELTRISTATQFNGVALLDGLMGSTTSEVGAAGGLDLDAAGGVTSITTQGATAGSYDLEIAAGSGAGLWDITIKDADGNSEMIHDVATPGNGATTAVEFTKNKITVNLNENIAVIAAADANTFKVTAGTGSAIQIGADGGETLNVEVDDMSAIGLAVDDETVTDAVVAEAAVTAIDGAISLVNTQRAKLGAYQNRLEHTIANLGTTIENLTSAESRVRDVDMAMEMSQFTKGQILQQAGTAMLAQANQRPQAVMQLLRG